MRIMLKVFFRIVSAGIIAMAALCGFVYLYGYSGVHITNKTGSTDYTWEPYQRMSTMTEGFAWIRMDQNGFNNHYGDISDPIDILLMGSSHMEAVQLDETENLGYLLNEKLPDMHTYNIGISGHTIYNCVRNMAAASMEFSPREYVLLETSDAVLDEDTMLEVICNSYDRIPSYDSGLIYLVQKHLPFVKSFYNSIAEWAGCDPLLSDDSSQADGTENGSGPTERYLSILGDFLKKAAADAGAKLVIFYHPSHSIDADGNLVDNTDLAYKNAFAGACEDNGIIFIDLTERFEELYEKERVMAHGFINTSPGYGHLNKYGHRAAAEVISDVLGGGVNNGAE